MEYKLDNFRVTQDLKTQKSHELLEQNEVDRKLKLDKRYQKEKQYEASRAAPRILDQQKQQHLRVSIAVKDQRIALKQAEEELAKKEALNVMRQVETMKKEVMKQYS